jgi:hypothetical protein
MRKTIQTPQDPLDVTAKAERDQRLDRKREALAAVAKVAHDNPLAASVLREMVEKVTDDDQARSAEAHAKMMERWREPKAELEGELTTMRKALTSLSRGLDLLEEFEPNREASARGSEALADIQRRLDRVQSALNEIDVRPEPKRGAPTLSESFYTWAWLALEELAEVGIKPMALAADMIAECLRPLLPYRTTPSGKGTYEFTGKSLLWTIRKRKRAGHTAVALPRQDFTESELERVHAMMFGGNSFGPDQVRAMLKHLDSK